LEKSFTRCFCHIFRFSRFLFFQKTRRRQSEERAGGRRRGQAGSSIEAGEDEEDEEGGASEEVVVVGGRRDLFCEWRYLKLSEKKNQNARYGVRAHAEKKGGLGGARGREFVRRGKCISFLSLPPVSQEEFREGVCACVRVCADACGDGGGVFLILSKKTEEQ
jgi:hypothetical protein